MSGKSTVSGRGRKPKPTALKKMAGNPGRRPLNEKEPDFKELTNIDPPEWLLPLADDMWKRVVPELLREKIIKITDLHLVESFCNSYAIWRMALLDVANFKIIMQNASGGPTKNPALTALNEANNQMMKTGAALGLSPADRTRLMGDKPIDDSNPFNEFF